MYIFLKFPTSREKNSSLIHYLCGVTYINSIAVDLQPMGSKKNHRGRKKTIWVELKPIGVELKPPSKKNAEPYAFAAARIDTPDGPT